MLRLGEPRFNFDVWEFPQMRVDDSGRSLTDEESAISLGDERDEMPVGRFYPFTEIRQFFNAIFAEGNAEFSDRTNLALRLARRAYQRSEFHEGLVQK